MAYQITICGGGNAAHVLAGRLASLKDLTVNVFTPYRDEALGWQRGVRKRGGILVVDPQGERVGQPDHISADPAQVVPGSQLVLLALPAFAHRSTLEAINPYLTEGVLVGALPARGGFDWEARQLLDLELERTAIFGLQTLPWACRIDEFGEKVTILGTKTIVDLAVWPEQRTDEIMRMLRRMLGINLKSTSNFLSLTLANTGQIIHPVLMYGLFANWDGSLFQQAPLFYGGVDRRIASLLGRVDDEIQTICSALEERFPAVDLTAVRPLLIWLRRAYRRQVSDDSTIQSCLVTNEAYSGLRAPMRKVSGGLIPDFQARYLSEDIPYGLVVTKGLAALMGVSTPLIDQVITWAQTRMGKEYVIDGDLRGRDLEETRAPQVYGIFQMEQLMEEVLV
jgi:hypothetical protein